MERIKAEYIWIDGHKPTAKLRSKTKIIDDTVKTRNDLPIWGFDGSSTMQAKEVIVTANSCPFILHQIQSVVEIIYW